MKTHELKIWPKYFRHVVTGKKTFEYRKNDRDFCFGDTVILREYDPTRDYVDASLQQLGEPKGYTGQSITFRIGYVLPIDIEHVVFSLLKPRT